MKIIDFKEFNDNIFYTVQFKRFRKICQRKRKESEILKGFYINFECSKCNYEVELSNNYYTSLELIKMLKLNLLFCCDCFDYKESIGRLKLLEGK